LHQLGFLASGGRRGDRERERFLTENAIKEIPR
jgi:hypothetical protein